MKDLEMVICPKCGRKMPKARWDMGYHYCVNCSTEKSVVCLVEGTQDGEGDDTVHSSITIMTQQDAFRVSSAKSNSRADFVEDEPALMLNTVEDPDENGYEARGFVDENGVDFDEQTLEDIERIQSEE